MTQHPNDQIDPVAIPTLSILLGIGPMLPILAGGGIALLAPSFAHSPWTAAVIVWAAAILLFIAGVRRGYGFARVARPSPGSLAGTMWIFLTGLLALPVMLVDVGPAIGVLLAGYASVAVLDRRSALRGEAPRHFARLRPPQMLVGIAGLAALLLSGAG